MQRFQKLYKPYYMYMHFFQESQTEDLFTQEIAAVYHGHMFQPTHYVFLTFALCVTLKLCHVTCSAYAYSD